MKKNIFTSCLFLYFSAALTAQPTKNHFDNNVDNYASLAKHQDTGIKQYQINGQQANWKGFSHLFLVLGNDANSNNPSCELNGEHYEYISAFLGDPSGQVINYSGWRKEDGTTLEPLHINLNTNAEISNAHYSANLQNNVLHCKGAICEAILGDGTRRIYKQVENLPSLLLAEELIPVLAKQVNEPQYYRLTQEIQPNNNQLFYSFDASGHLFSVDIIDENVTKKQLNNPQNNTSGNFKRYLYSDDGLNFLGNEVDHEGHETIYFYEPGKTTSHKSNQKDLLKGDHKSFNPELENNNSYISKSAKHVHKDTQSTQNQDPISDFANISASNACRKPVQGPPGPQGLIGPTGNTGPIGPTGPQGPTGTFTGEAWLTTGNAGTDATINFVGTTDATAFVIATNNNHAPTGGTRFTLKGQIETLGTGESVFLGEGAGDADVIGTGIDNTFVGFHAGFSNTIGSQNTALGAFSLESNTIAFNNTAVGFAALNANTTGSPNTSVGSFSLILNTTGAQNTALGFNTLANNTSGGSNTALGHQSMFSNTVGIRNTGVGFGTLAFNVTGNNSTAVGYRALNGNTASDNTAVGFQALLINTTGTRNTALGTSTLQANATGPDNTAVGYQALIVNRAADNTAVGSQALLANTTGTRNTALGTSTLQANATGPDNTAVGYRALFVNRAAENTAVGSQALLANTTGTRNTALGTSALQTNIIANDNTAVGYHVLLANLGGTRNTGVGASALTANTSASDNTAVGYQSLLVNTTGARNTALGTSTLTTNGIGNDNTALGYQTLNLNTAGSNTAVGSQALTANTTAIANTALGASALTATTTGSFNTAVGSGALVANTIGTNNTAIGFATNVAANNLTNATALGNGAIVNASNKVRIGNATVSVVEGQVAYTFPSDSRIKKDITESVPGLAFITKLRPVTYHLDMDQMAIFLKTPEELRSRDSELLQSQILKTGFIAQEVEQAALDIEFDFDGVTKPQNEDDYYGLAYSSFVVPLVKAVQEQQALIESQQSQINTLINEINLLKAQ